MESNIEVAVRIRPPVQTKRLLEDVCLYSNPRKKEVVLANQLSFYVDYALPIEITQNQMFDSIILSRIDDLIKGINTSYIAYGHVNSGKTFTLLGPGLNCTLSENTQGIVPRFGREIFNKLLAFRQQFGLQFKILVSFVEICNEKVADLLSSQQNTWLSNNVGFVTNEWGMTILSGAEEKECSNVGEFFNCLQTGMGYRRTCRTNYNMASSMSHAVIIIKLEQKWLNNFGQTESICSQAMFVDLAGEEQMCLTSPLDTNQINNVIPGNLGLGVISAIISSFSGQWLPSTPFTQSLLFPLLKDSFMGSIKTLLICCLSPTSTDYSKTLNSLRLIEHIHTLNKYSTNHETGLIKNNYNNGTHLLDNNIQIDSINSANNLAVSNLNDNCDQFGLEFAASQMMRLVSNAEGLFNKLSSNSISNETRMQIEEWLCLKQECEECFGIDPVKPNDKTVSDRKHVLDIIEEVTESESKSKSEHSSSNLYNSEDSEAESNNGDVIVNNNKTVNKTYENSAVNISTNETASDYGSSINIIPDEDLIKKVKVLNYKFEMNTDKIVDSEMIKKPLLEKLFNSKEQSSTTSIKSKTSNNIRRNSITPEKYSICASSFPLNKENVKINNNTIEEEKENEERGKLEVKNVADKDGNSKTSFNQEEPESSVSKIVSKSDDSELRKNELNNKNNKEKGKNTESYEKNDKSKNIKSECKNEGSQSKNDDVNSSTVSDDVKDKISSKSPKRSIGFLNRKSSRNKNLILISSCNDIKKKISLSTLDLEGVSKRIEELQTMIKIKEKFIEDIKENSGNRISAKTRFQKKHLKLEEEYGKSQMLLIKAEKALKYDKDNVSLQNEVKNYKELTLKYEKRLQDIDLIKQMAGDSAIKVLELENSLQNTKRKLQKLKNQLKKEMELKYKLEQEILKNQKHIKILEKKKKIHSNRLKNKTGDHVSNDSENEEKRWINIQLSSEKLQEEIKEKLNILDKRESFLKDKLSQSKKVSTSLLNVSSRVSHLEQVFKEESVNSDVDLNTKEELRHDIRNLRKVKECLVKQKKDLCAKFNEDKVFTEEEQRKYLECDEAIEAIDSTIEYKNELICGRKRLDDSLNSDLDKGEEMLLARLMNLSPMEMRILLYKYFYKVVDLRESGKKMETQIAELDNQCDSQLRKIKALNNGLLQANLENERRLISIQKEHEEKLHLIFRHLSEETSCPSSDTESDRKTPRQNQAMKQRILELEAMLYKSKRSSSSRGVPSMSTAIQSNQIVPVTSGSSLIPHSHLKKLQNSSIQPTTRVSWFKKKLIIQQVNN